LNDFDLRLEGSQITLAEDDRLPQPLLFLHDAFPLVVEQPLSRQRPRASETGEQYLGRQFRFLLLHVGFALLKHAPCLVQAFGSRQKRLYLQLQFDALPPEEFVSLHIGISRSLVILVWLMALSLVLSLIAMGLLLMVHEKPSFPGAGGSSRLL
jgi:hypothetical protein